MDELPPEAYANEPARYWLELPLRGFFAPPDGADDTGALLRVNQFRDVDRSIASACTGLPGTVPDRPFVLSARQPADGVWIASVVELATAPKPARVGLERLTPTWWQGVVGASRAEIALRADGEPIGFVVQVESAGLEGSVR